MAPVVVRSLLVVAHTIGVLVAGTAAVFEIRSILLSGPILALTGILVAALSYRVRRRIGFYFGLTAPTVALAWFLIIFCLSWGPGDAHLPVSLFLIVFALANIPGCVFCISELLAPHSGAEHRFQFSIRELLAITFFAALYLGLLRTLDIFGRLYSLWSSSHSR